MKAFSMNTNAMAPMAAETAETPDAAMPTTIPERDLPENIPSIDPVNAEILAKVGIDDNERTKCEVWTRVMGYHRPKANANIGKQGEFAERKYFTEGTVDARFGEIKVETDIGAGSLN